MKLVLDTDVLIAGLRSPTGASAELLRMARRREIEIAVSVPLVLEYEAKAILPEHRAIAGLEEVDVQAVIETLVDVAEWTRVHFSWRPQTRDPGDEMVLETAINAQADAIATFNRRDFGMAPARFGIAVSLPRQVLETLR